jgi:hypothetical protein
MEILESEESSYFNMLLFKITTKQTISIIISLLWMEQDRKPNYPTSQPFYSNPHPSHSEW